MSRLFIYESNVILTIVLCRLSLLLCAGWLLHAALRGRNPWLSIWSWRVIIAGVVVVVITGPYLQAWGPEFGPGYRNLSRPQERSTKFDKVDLGNSNREPNEHDETRADVNMVDVATFPSAEIANGNRSLAKFVRWIRLSIDGKTLWKGYCAVVGILLSQLFFQFIGIQKILRRAEPGDDDIESLVRTTAQSLGLGKPPGVLLSTLVSGPLATGILRPTIVLPVGMADQFSDRDLRFVIAHECSHFAGGDLGWALAARVLRILLWPHPLAWGIPTAHRLACDIRCDAVAAGRDTAGYIKMLAGLAISWHARSVPALTMAFLGQSETIRRVELLDAGIGRDRPSLFRQLHTVLGLGIVVGLIGTMGTNHSRTGVALGQTDSGQVKRILVTVVDKLGKPIEGAEIDSPNLRTRKEPDSHYGNPSNKVIKTNKQGIAEIHYPEYVYEKMETGQVTFNVTHPEYVTAHLDQSVDLPIKITLDSGRRVRLTARDVSTGQRMTGRLFVLLSDNSETMPWSLTDGDVYLSHPVSNETRLMLVVCVREGQPTLFSDLIDLSKYPPGDCRIDDVGLSLGRRISGRLSDDVPRPVVKGEVGLVIASSVSDSPLSENSILWEDYVLTNEDGTFEFPSVPRNEVFQLIANCRGWVSITPSPEQIAPFRKITPDEHVRNEHDRLVVAQHFAAGTLDPVEIKMEPLASCLVTVQDETGTPIPEVSISVSSHTSWSPDFTGGIGYYSKTSATLGLKKDEAYRLIGKLWASDAPDDSDPGLTDSNGQVKIRNLAGKKGTWVGAFHQHFELPTSKRDPYHRSTTVDLTPGKMSEIKLTLQRKGAEIIGE